MIIKNLNDDAEIRDVLYEYILENVPEDLIGMQITGIEDVYLDEMESNFIINGTCTIEVEKEDEDYNFNSSFNIEIDEELNEIQEILFNVDFN